MHAVNVQMKGIMVDGGATSHILNNIDKFNSFDNTFRPESHSVELADGTKCSGIAQRRGTAVIYLLDNTGRLYMPSYPHNIFSVARVANGGATVTFKKEDSHMIMKDGSRFDIMKVVTCITCPLLNKMLINAKLVTTCKHGMKCWVTAIMKMYESCRML